MRLWRRKQAIVPPARYLKPRAVEPSEDDQLLEWLKALPEGEAKAIRSDAGWTQAEVAEHVGLNSGGSQVGRWERAGTGWSRVSGVESQEQSTVGGQSTTAARRLWLALAMTLDYSGRFPRRKMFPLYWRLARRLR